MAATNTNTPMNWTVSHTDNPKDIKCIINTTEAEMKKYMKYLPLDGDEWTAFEESPTKQVVVALRSYRAVNKKTGKVERRVARNMFRIPWPVCQQ